MSIFLIELPVLLLLSGKGKKAFLLIFCLYLVVCSFMFVFQKKKSKIGLNIQYPVLTISLCLVFSVLFYLRWNTSFRMNFISKFLNIPTKQTWLLSTSLLAMCSTFGIDYFIKQIFFILPLKSNSQGSRLSKIQTVLIIFFCGLVMITLNSQCSPLYPTNNWDDPNTIFTVGKSILKGYVPYRDLYEQKGPLLLFLQVPAAFVSFTSFTGVWIIEVICAFFFLLFSYKTAEIYVQKKAIILIPFLALISYSSYAFRYGASAEEFILPLLSYTLYIGCKSIKINQLPSNKEFFLIGITSACVFWVKYSIIGFHFGWFLFFLILSIRYKKCKKLFIGLFLIAAGVFLVSLPILIYFFTNKALNDLWQSYFYNLMFRYRLETNGIHQIVSDGCQSFFNNNAYCFLLILLSFLWFSWNHYRKNIFFTGFTVLGLFFSVYSGGRFLNYYSLIFNIYLILGLSCAADVLRQNLLKKIHLNKISLATALFFLCDAWICLISHNMFYLRYEQDDLMQFRMRDVIRESGIENPNVINWDLGETGVNTVLGSIPTLRYFCFYNSINNPEIKEAIENCMNQKCADYVLLTEKFEDTYPELENYQHMGAFPGFINGNYRFLHYYVPQK